MPPGVKKEGGAQLLYSRGPISFFCDGLTFLSHFHQERKSPTLFFHRGRFFEMMTFETSYLSDYEKTKMPKRCILSPLLK